MRRPDGTTGPLLLDGRARDLFTDVDGTTRVIAEATLDTEVAVTDGWRVRAITSNPAADGLDALVGISASAGFRGVAERELAGLRAAKLPLYLLIDDVPSSTLVSGYSSLFAGIRPNPGANAKRILQAADICAGWRSGGTIMQHIETQGAPATPTGPDCPSLLDPADPIAWHEFGPMGPNGMRRHRRLDLIAGDVMSLDVFFRDSHTSFGGRETVIHEYTLTATLDPETFEVLTAVAVGQVLPFVECIDAVDSARRLVGQAVRNLRRTVRNDFVGPTTCTHLNDTMRSLEDLEALIPTLHSLLLP
jgi:hypothetical protein